MGLTLFKRPSPRKDEADSGFAATVATLPPGVEAAVPLPAAEAGESPESVPPDSQPFENSQPFDSQLPSDSLPPDSVPPEALAALDAAEGLPNAAPAQPSAGPFDPHPPAELPAYLGGPAPPQPAARSAEQAASALPMADQPTLAMVGRYALKRHLGLGGLGQVHEAWDPLLSRTVAIKTLQFESDPRTRNSLDRLFLNEARAVAGLSHPNIVTVYDAGLSPSGVYLAMERLQGKDLRQKLAEGWKPGPAVVAQLVRRVADALAYAHARGVVHCDIKPGNIFIIGSDKPKVLDFGIARVAHGRAVPAALQGTVAGSPHYLAPEQLLDKDVDARTDIYSLGVVFYELLSGRRAFAGDSVEQITTAVLTNHPAPAHLIRAGVPEALSAIAARAMARDPEARYATASEMAADIRNWFEQPRPAASPGAERTERSAGRRARGAAQKKADAGGPRRWPWALAGATAALAGLVAVGLLVALRPGTRAPAADVNMASANPAPGGVTAAPGAGARPRDGEMVMSGGVPVAEPPGTSPAATTATTATTATAAPNATASAGTDAAAAGSSGAGAAAAGAAPQNPATGPEAGKGGAAASGSTPAAPPGAQPTAQPANASGSPSGPAARAAAPRPDDAQTNARAAIRPRETTARKPAAAAGPAPSAAAATAVAPPATGTLQLAITPWGEVEIDGRSAGTTPPLTQFTLPAGTHNITVRNADFPPFSTTVQVVADKPVVVRHRFGQ